MGRSVWAIDISHQMFFSNVLIMDETCDEVVKKLNYLSIVLQSRLTLLLNHRNWPYLIDLSLNKHILHIGENDNYNLKEDD